MESYVRIGGRGLKNLNVSLHGGRGVKNCQNHAYVLDDCPLTHHPVNYIYRLSISIVKNAEKTVLKPR